MGRYIECQVGREYEIVWKYGFGVQNSEMMRIHTELGLGEYHLIQYDEEEYQYVPEDEMDVDGDILILDRKDIPKLKEQIQLCKGKEKTEADQWYIGMLEAICNFMVEHPEQDQFVFEGEF